MQECGLDTSTRRWGLRLTPRIPERWCWVHQSEVLRTRALSPSASLAGEQWQVWAICGGEVGGVWTQHLHSPGLKPEKIIIQKQACDHGNRQRCSQKETSSYSSRLCQHFYHQGLTELPQRTTKMSSLTKSYKPLGEINIMQSCDTQKPNLPHRWGRRNMCGSGNGGLLYMCIVQLLDN